MSGRDNNYYSGSGSSGGGRGGGSGGGSSGGRDYRDGGRDNRDNRDGNRGGYDNNNNNNNNYNNNNNNQGGGGGGYDNNNNYNNNNSGGYDNRDNNRGGGNDNYRDNNRGGGNSGGNRGSGYDNRDNRNSGRGGNDNYRDSNRDSGRDNRGGDYHRDNNRDGNRDNRGGSYNDNRGGYGGGRDNRDGGYGGGRDNRDGGNRDGGRDNRDGGNRDGGYGGGRDNRDGGNRDGGYGSSNSSGPSRSGGFSGRGRSGPYNRPGGNFNDRSSPPNREMSAEEREANSTRVTMREAAPPRGRPRSDIRDSDVQGLATKTRNIGTQYKQIWVYANFFPIIFKAGSIYQYQLDFQPEQISRDVRATLVSKLDLKVYRFDGGFQFYSPEQLENTSVDVGDVKISYKCVSVISSNDPKSVLFLNVLTKKLFHLMGFSLIGRNYYSPNNLLTIREHNLEIWKGFTSSVSRIESGTSLLCDLSTKVIRSLDVYRKFSELSFNAQKCEQSIIGSIVITRYNNKTYRIIGVDWSKTIQDNINDEIGTYENYYKKNYPNFRINHRNQPLLITEIKFKGVKQNAYLIPELCYITGLGEEILSNFHIMKQVADFSNIDPPTRIKDLNSFIKNIPKNERIAKELNDWGVEYRTSLKVEGIVLPPPKLRTFKDKLRHTNWVFMVTQEDFDRCRQHLQTLLRETGLPDPRICHPRIQRRGRDIDPRCFTDEMEHYAKEGVKLFVIIIPPNSKEVYESIKRKALLEHKVLTQCIFSKTFQKGRPVAVKLNQQMVAKMGEAPWVLENSTHQAIPKKTLIIGIDIGHNTDHQFGRSVIGFVASLNDDFSKFYSNAVVQNQSGKEIIDSSLCECTKEALKRYHHINGCLPEVIMVYRDGVGDGMLDMVLKHEVTSVQRAFTETPDIYGPKPKLIYTIVKKNTNVRFFEANQLGNPEPGTLIEHLVTHPGWYDFFLVSQVAFKGSINPTHYHVIYDDALIPADAYQQFTFQMCHLYYNYDKSVRVPAPCQYAHRLAFLIGRHVHRNAANDLSEKLYFL